MTVAVHWWIMENLIGIQSLPQSAPPQREYKGNLSTLASRMAKPWAVKPQSQLSLASAFGGGQAGLFCRRDMWPSEEVKRTQETDLPRDVDTALLWWGSGNTKQDLAQCAQWVQWLNFPLGERTRSLSTTIRHRQRNLLGHAGTMKPQLWLHSK